MNVPVVFIDITLEEQVRKSDVKQQKISFFHNPNIAHICRRLLILLRSEFCPSVV
jgi:hypothetical protein